jgi:hypothetical protein
VSKPKIGIKKIMRITLPLFTCSPAITYYFAPIACEARVSKAEFKPKIIEKTVMLISILPSPTAASVKLSFRWPINQ